MMSHRFTRTIKRTGLLAGISAAMLLVVDSAAARPRALSWQDTEQQVEPIGPTQDRLMPSQRGGGGVSMQQATAIALNAFPGRVVGARKVEMGDHAVYEIRILGEDGRTVRTFRVDAQTGALL